MARWSADSVLDLAPDESSRRAASGLGQPGRWSSAGVAGDLLWGLCAGSGKNPYQTVVDLSGPAYKCSCPSRKFPCKHALGLLLTWANGNVQEAGEPADFAAAWLADRRARAEKALVRTVPADSSSSADPGTVKDAAAAARRVEQRAQRVANGLAELESWLRDQVLVGLSASASAAAGGSAGSAGSAGLAASAVSAPGRGHGYGYPRGHADEIAARMVDAQAPGVAGVLRGLSEVPASGEGWPGRLLAEYGQLHLLALAHQRLAALPPELAATVRSRIGYPTSRADVLARIAVTDHWAVLGVRDLLDGQVPGRRIWLRGRDSGRWAMLLTFAAPAGAGGAGGWQDPDTARLRAGTELHASLHYYPGGALRAAAGERHAPPAAAPPPVPAGDADVLLAEYAAGLEQDPWLTVWPAVLTGTPVPPGGVIPPASGGGPDVAGSHRNRWHLVDRAGAALPLAERESLWTLLAVSGGYPVTVAGEWHPDGLLPLTVWHGNRAVAL
ncbi:MAG TPA: SWIM zinc finger family protein [Trebonia sp.]|nr:SWIM zinc finger family protein [Trebonia sp.]